MTATERLRRAAHRARGARPAPFRPAPSTASPEPASIEEVLAQAAAGHRRLFFRSQPGNAGDALINAGFYGVAERMGLRYTEIRRNRQELTEVTGDDLVILTGGGSLSDHWDFGAPTLTALTAQDFPLLLLPCSLRGNEDALRTLRAGDTLMTRERYSYDYAQSLRLRCRILLADDMAFHADVAQILRTPPWRRPRTRDDLRRAAAFGQHRLQAVRGRSLQAWRTDAEASYDASGNQRRYDISSLADFGTLDRRSSLYSAQWLLRVAGWYRQVATDRLHMGIACLLMGTPVTLYANDYHKIRGVYEHSIAPYPHRSRLVRFSGEVPGAREPAPVVEP